MKPAEAEGCAYFNEYGMLRICFTHNPRLWPGSRVYNPDPTCTRCIEMLARRVEVCFDRLSKRP